MSEPRPTDPLEAPLSPGPAAWQRAWHEVIFGAETPAGKAFDVALLVTILLSILVLMLETVDEIRESWSGVLLMTEWVITLLFSLEYLARLACVARPSRYAHSFFGWVDLLSILPTYLALLAAPGTQALATVRALRLLRVFRVLKMTRHLREARTLLLALRQTWPKITVFMMVIFCSIVILGTVMYYVEGEVGKNPDFENIPRSIYWAIVTITTVGYGDLTPVTPFGQLVATIVMLLGYAIIIVPTGIFSAEVMNSLPKSRLICDSCGSSDHRPDANYCAQCGERLTSRA